MGLASILAWKGCVHLAPLADGPPLIATDFVSRFDPETARTFSAELRRAFVEHELLPDVEDVLLMGRGGVSDPRTLVAANRFSMRLPSGAELRIPALWMSHGYQSTIAWVADLVGQVWSEGGRIPLSEIEGLVIIDEIDLHLHPTWQRGLIRSLRRALPRVQLHRYLRLASDAYRSDEEDGEMDELRTWLQREGVPVAYSPVPRRQP